MTESSGESLAYIHGWKTSRLPSPAWLAQHWGCIVGSWFEGGSVGSSWEILAEVGSLQAEWGCGGIGGKVAAAVQQCSHADMGFHAGPVAVAAVVVVVVAAAGVAEVAAGVVVVEVEIGVEKAVVV